MNTVCKENMCAGCMACVEICPKNAITIEDSLSAYNAIKTDQCIDCGACVRVCQVNNPPQFFEPIHCIQGWAEDANVRESSSSGGFATEISKAFMEHGGYVCSCAFEEGEFKFVILSTPNDVVKTQGSKYVKSNPVEIYKKVACLLHNGEKVLFIGLPCQSAALQNFVGQRCKERLYTIDLICHGTPSPKLLEIFLQEKGHQLVSMTDVRFRIKKRFGISEKYETIVPKGVTDRYTIGFLHSLFYTDNCYNCQYAKFERISDLTLGDSWGSTLPEDERERGISLALCQSEKGKELLNMAALHLEDVDIENAVDANHQLKHPSIPPENRNYFFEGVKKGKSFNYLVSRCFPRICLRQDVKQFLLSAPIIGKIAKKRIGGGVNT